MQTSGLYFPSALSNQVWPDGDWIMTSLKVSAEGLKY